MHRTQALSGLLLLCALAAPSGCAKDEGSILLIFPNDVARNVIRRLRVEAYSPDASGTGLSDRSCISSFLGKAGEGQNPIGAPIARGDFTCPDDCPDGWFADQFLPRVPAGRQILYVLAYASTAEGDMPILEGCTDAFDSSEDEGELEDVEVRFQFVVPRSARVARIRGDRQVGRGGTLGLPVTVEVRAESPFNQASYTIPALPVEFVSESDGYAVDGQERVQKLIGADRAAEAIVSTPLMSGNGRIRAVALPLVGVEGTTSSVTFSVSVAEPIRFAQTEVVRQSAGRPVAVRLGRLDDDPGADDLAWLTCEGTDTECGLAPVIPNPGAARAGVIRNVGAATGRRLVSAPAQLGILPTDLALVDMVPPYGVQEVALLNARRGECQQRTCVDDGLCPCFGLPPGEPCPCEGSEIRLFEAQADEMVSLGRYTLTASNAVGMTVVPRLSVDDLDGLVVAARGRMRNDRPCNRNNTCSQPNVTGQRQLCEGSPEVCGCPPNEFCECPNCSTDSSAGFCQANDKSLDFLAVRTFGTTELYNRGGCKDWVRSCDGEPLVSSCECRDNNEGMCTGSDGCGCIVPRRVRLGQIEAPVLPFGIVSGRLREGQADDIIVPSLGGLELVRSGGSTGFEYRGSPIVNAPIHRAVIVQLDQAAEMERGPPVNAALDVAWIARDRCTGAGYIDQCPIVDANEGDAPRVGCMGVYFTDGETSVFRVQFPTRGGCRRHALTFRPDGICAGRFNNDEFVDIAIASRNIPDVLVFSGDGRGGLLDPPERFALPDIGGGPLACGRLDGDALDDIAVFTTDSNGRMTGIALLKTSP